MQDLLKIARENGFSSIESMDSYHTPIVKLSKETKGTYSVAVFDPKQVKIIGLESTSEKKGPKKFYVNEAFV